jgi:ABC-type multidrug transport system ATPase subunit
METDILTIQALTKSFSRKIMNSDGGEDDEQYWIIKDLFLNVPRGKVIALIGGNGAGKTTLFNIISGFVKPDSGSIIFKGDGCGIRITENATASYSTNGARQDVPGQPYFSRNECT